MGGFVFGKGLQMTLKGVIKIHPNDSKYNLKRESISYWNQSLNESIQISVMEPL